MTDTDTTSEKRSRRTPVLDDTFEGEIPQSSRNGFWVNAVNDIKQSPGKVFVYKNVSPTAASNLRRNYGLNAHTRTIDGETVLYVAYDPEKVDEIKAAVAARGEKRKAAAASKASKPAAPATKASK